jgi:hypothetical protein
MTRSFNLFKRPITLLTAVFWVPLLLFGSEIIARLSPANAQSDPDPQYIFDEDELPPPLPSLSPSPSTIPSFNVPVPTSPFPPTPPNPPPVGREFNFEAPTQPIFPSTPISPSRLYRVDVFGNSPFLLFQVQQIEPQAFIRQEDGVIQAGVFADQFNAQSRVRALEAQGIQARVTTAANDDTIDSERFSGDRTALDRNIERSSSYFVIIPGKARDLPDIADRVVQLGVRRSEVSERDSPRGAHVAVGPFDERQEADGWSSYFQSIGMDARVYYRR